MKTFRFKFQQNRIINEEFDFWREGGQGDRIHKFEFGEGDGAGPQGVPIYKFYSQLLLETCENVPFQIYAKSHHKLKLDCGEQLDCGGRVGSKGSSFKNSDLNY